MGRQQEAIATVHRSAELLGRYSETGKIGLSLAHGQLGDEARRYAGHLARDQYIESYTEPWTRCLIARFLEEVDAVLG